MPWKEWQGEWDRIFHQSMGQSTLKKSGGEAVCVCVGGGAGVGGLEPPHTDPLLCLPSCIRDYNELSVCLGLARQCLISGLNWSFPYWGYCEHAQSVLMPMQVRICTSAAYYMVQCVLC